MANTRKLTVEILGDTKGISGAFGDADAKMGAFSKSFMAVGLAIGVAAVAAGVALFKMGQDLDEAFDTIQIKTGATGENLEGLKQSFRDVAVTTPADLNTVALAVAGLAQRVDESAPGFDALVQTVVDLTEMTGGDMTTNLDAVTRLMGDWAISVDDGSASLDKLFRLGQATGTTVEGLSALMVTFGSPMRALGFTFDETAAMLAKFEAEGVNTELVMGSMRKALGKLASEGKDAPTALRETMQAIKDAGTASEGTALAVELFGAKAGPDMAAAIREGRMEIDDLITTMNTGEGTISGMADSTEDAGEKFKQLKNRVTIALEPLASGVFDAVGKAMTAIGPVVEDLAAKFMEHWPAIQAEIQKVVEWFVVNWPAIQQTIADVWNWIQANVIPVIQDIVEGVSEAVASLVAYFQEHMPEILEAVEHVINAIKFVWDIFGDEIIAILKAVFEVIKAVVTEAFEVLKNTFEFFINIINGEWGAAWDNLKNIFFSVWDAIVAILNGAIQIIWQIIQVAFDVIRDLFILGWQKIFEVINGAVQWIADTLTAMWNWVVGIFQGAWNTISTIVGGMVSGIVNFFAGLWGSVTGYISEFVNGITGAFSGVVDSITGVFAGIPEAFKTAWNAFANFVNGISIDIPGLSVGGVEVFGGVSWDMPDVVPTFHTGGIVPGRGETLALLQGGEGVFTPDQMAVLAQGGGTTGGVNYTMHVHTRQANVGGGFRRMELMHQGGSRRG